MKNISKIFIFLLFFAAAFGSLGIYPPWHAVKVFADNPVTDTFSDITKIQLPTNNINVDTGAELVKLSMPWNCGDILTDPRDGKTYATVLIGSQCWMAQNINIGTRINGAEVQEDNTNIEKYCYADKDANCDSNNNPNYPDGGLYQWDEAMQYAASCNGTGPPPNDRCASPVQGICPAGWHIPSHYEWTTLEKNVGSNPGAFPYNETTVGWLGTDEGTNLKPNGSSGFEANLTGYRQSSGSFYYREEGTIVWSSSGDDRAWRRDLTDTESRVYRNTLIKSSGLPVRCLKDEEGPYYTSGNWTSTNLLSGENVSSIDNFSYTLSDKPADTGATIQFSQDANTWYNSSGDPDGTDTLNDGTHIIGLSSLGWSGANFYYRVAFTSGGASTPVLDEINLNFTSPPPPPPPEEEERGGGGVVPLFILDPIDHPPGGFRIVIEPEDPDDPQTAGAEATDSRKVNVMLVGGSDTIRYALYEEWEGNDFFRAIQIPFEGECMPGFLGSASAASSETGFGGFLIVIIGLTAILVFLLIAFPKIKIGWKIFILVLILLGASTFLVGIRAQRQSQSPPCLAIEEFNIKEPGFGNKTICASFYSRAGETYPKDDHYKICDDIELVEEMPSEEILPTEAELPEEPETAEYCLGPGDYLVSIARDFLGTGAFVEDVKNLVEQIALLNDIEINEPGENWFSNQGAKRTARALPDGLCLEIPLPAAEEQALEEGEGLGIIDCGTSELANDCFVDAARNCSPAKLVTETEMDFFGVLIHSETYREIKGLQDGRCLVYQRTDENYVAGLSEEIRQQILAQGGTEADIQQQLSESNQQAQEMVGKDSTCRYPIDDLVAILEEEKQGSFSFSTDVTKYQCTGSLYEIGG